MVVRGILMSALGPKAIALPAKGLTTTRDINTVPVGGLVALASDLVCPNGYCSEIIVSEKLVDFPARFGSDMVLGNTCNHPMALLPPCQRRVWRDGD
jgi:hypothetical protein